MMETAFLHYLLPITMLWAVAAAMNGLLLCGPVYDEYGNMQSEKLAVFSFLNLVGFLIWVGLLIIVMIGAVAFTFLVHGSQL